MLRAQFFSQTTLIEKIRVGMQCTVGSNRETTQGGDGIVFILLRKMFEPYYISYLR